MTRPTRLVVVAGTGTEVGKTWVAAELCGRLRAGGTSVAARKPAQSFEPDDPPAGTDAAVLARATGATPEEVCPPHRWYETAMAPPMAADSLGRPPLLLDDLVAELDASWPDDAVDVGFVEMAGGSWSPVTHDADCIELTAALSPELIVLVADAGLGTLNVVRPAVATLSGIAPIALVLNRYDDGSELHRRNRDWLVDREQLRPYVDLDEAATAVATATPPRTPPRT